MHVRRVENAEYMDVAKLWSVCFLQETDMEAEKRRSESQTETLTPLYGCYTDEGKLMAIMADNQYTMRFDGHLVRLSGIGGVAAYPEYRRSGAVREIFGVLLRKLRAEGVLFSSLYPFSHEFYRKFGYELARVGKQYHFSPLLLKKYAADIDARMLDKDDDRELLRPVYERFAEGYNLVISRDKAKLARITASDPYAHNAYAYALYDAGAVIAYVCFSKNASALKVTDYAYCGAQGLRSIFGLLYRMSAQFKTVELPCRPDDLPLPALVDAPYELECETNANYMLRALDCEKALELLDKRGAPAFTIQIDDEFLPENGGVWRVEGDSVIKTHAAPDLRLSVMAFAQLAAGYTDLRDALLRPDAALYANEAALARVFVKKPAMVGVHF